MTIEPCLKYLQVYQDFTFQILVSTIKDIIDQANLKQLPTMFQVMTSFMNKLQGRDSLLRYRNGYTVIPNIISQISLQTPQHLDHPHFHQIRKPVLDENLINSPFIQVVHELFAPQNPTPHLFVG